MTRPNGMSPPGEVFCGPGLAGTCQVCGDDIRNSVRDRAWQTGHWMVVLVKLQYEFLVFLARIFPRASWVKRWKNFQLLLAMP